MDECVECGHELGPDGEASVCEGCAQTNIVEKYAEKGSVVEDWATCPVCDGSGKCFYCSPGGPCYHCSGSGREMPGSEEECHICSGDGSVDKGCEMCDHTRECKHCNGSGKVPTIVLRNA